MRILMLAGNYAPEETASAPLNTDVCNYLAAAGHSVFVVTTFPHYPQWKVRKEYAGTVLSPRDDRRGFGVPQVTELYSAAAQLVQTRPLLQQFCR